MADVPKMLRNGITVSLGVDGAASNNAQDMVELMKFTALQHKVATRDPLAMTAEKVLEMATIGGARALKLDDKIGSLEIGKLADIIAVDLSGSHQTPTTDPVSAVVNTCSGADILMTLVNGTALYEKNKWNVGGEVARNIARIIEIRGKLRL